ncbi:MAG TPA: hypothetical protein VIZ68_04635, partial [Thermoplasmata archaeon]
MPGADPSGQAFIDGPALALRQWRAALDAPGMAPGPLKLGSVPPTAHPTSPVPIPAANNGTIGGRIYDLTLGRPVVGAAVELVPVGAAACSPSPCPSVLTDVTGSFLLSSTPGTVSVVFTAPYYISNRTWVTVASDTLSPLGILFLIHDGMVIGVVEDDSPNQAPIAGATISATSRDQLIGTSPGATSAANGSFLLPVPPVPTQIDITPPVGPPFFFGNATWVNLTPYATLDLGVIHLEGGVPVTATLVDGVTGLPIPNATPTQITVCTRRADLCLPPVINQTGAHPTGYGLPGPAFLKVYAIGYLRNSTLVADLPNTDQTVDLGTIELVPVAVVEISVNLTGGPPPPGPWVPVNLTAYACSLDGLEVTYQISAGSSLASSPCTPRGVANASVPTNHLTVGTTALLAAAPLRDVIFLTPDPPCGCATPEFPIATNQVTTLTSLFPVQYENITWVNASSDRITNAGSVDVAAGTIISGNVSLTGVSGSLSGLFEVQACSTDETTLCGLAVGSSSDDPAAGPAGCPVTDHSFCAPAPPGPVVITVTQIGSQAQNRTWLEVPRGCCSQDGHPTDVGWINVTGPATGSVHGSVVAQTGGPGSDTVRVAGVLAAAVACPVGPTPYGQPTAPCGSTVVNASTGAFNMSAPLGWDKVSVTATGYAANWTWVFVSGSNDTGVIELAPEAVLLGAVRAAGGGLLFSADVQACPVARILLCSDLGTTNSFGQFNGTVLGGPLPWGTYEILATAAGFAPSWTWVNTSAGAVVHVPPVVLRPIGGVAPPAPGVRPAAANGTVGVWVDGRIVDQRTGLGLPSTLVNECAVVGGGCIGSVQSTTAGGTFNVSVLLGQYYLVFSATNYRDLRVYVNATGTTDVHLGTLSMTHYPWVSGRVLIDPWRSLGVSAGLGVPATILGCDAPGTTCGSGAATDSGGFFNVSVPSGVQSSILVTGKGISGFGSAVSGFDEVHRTLDAFGTFIYLPTSGPSVTVDPIFGALVGTLTDGSTWNASLGAAQRACDFCAVGATALNSNLTSYLPVAVGAGGNYTFFLPSDGTSTLLRGSGSAYWSTNLSLPGHVVSGSVSLVGPLDLPHYGWVALSVVDANGSAPLPFAFVTASLADPANRTTWQTQTIVRGDGYANLSAPPGTAVTVEVTAPGYFNQTL